MAQTREAGGAILALFASLPLIVVPAAHPGAASHTGPTAADAVIAADAETPAWAANDAQCPLCLGASQARSALAERDPTGRPNPGARPPAMPRSRAWAPMTWFVGKSHARAPPLV